MVRIYKVLIVSLTLLLLSGCTNLSWTTAGKIIPPLKNVCALEGKWTVIQDLKSSGNSSEDNQNWVGESAQFTQNAAMLGDYVWSKPTYKIKKVNSTDYLMTKYLNLSSTLVPDSEEVDVITVSAAENFLGEFMKIDDSKVIGFIQNNALYLQKVSDQVDNSLATANPNEFNTNDQSMPGTSGVLVGLRVPSETDSNSEHENNFKYQTLWIAADNKKLRSILTGNNIFFPRSSGFWELQVRNALNGTKIENELSAHDVTTKIPVKQERVMGINQKIVDKGTFIKTIDYVGNDYVAIENDSSHIKHLQVLPVDKISASSGIKLSDLLGTNGLTAYRSARARPLRVLSNEGITLVDEDEFEENFGLTRKNGHWYLQGRINYHNEGELHYMDYNVNLIPPAKLIYYDTLCLSWQNIKDRIPDAMDAFTSPNRDIALVITKSKLYVYGISADLLDSEPLAKIDMNIGETVVMAEWATGSYVDNWEKAFLANGAKVMSYDNEK
ncbi:hypothetical protein [Desulfosporosinus sp. OT]|uniref:hypothetical protein n=1 Tax=Desulfosporosinus sp. OT TaxID=913865 RepID=UPI000223A97A|nr:hypothetical protein [Desulfosporosinus sp. OT]EGW37698.1 hypothetical protein DOT_4439 [Desulfosporosinus sp. OT]